MCKRCPHKFHSTAGCLESVYVRHEFVGCECRGHYDLRDLDLSGFCFPMELGDPAAHDDCPGKAYPYPCFCGCHSESLDIFGGAA